MAFLFKSPKHFFFVLELSPRSGTVHKSEKKREFLEPFFMV